MDSSSVNSQLTSAFSAYTVDAVKSGMIPTQESVETICDALQQFHGSKPFVLDPVLRTTSGTTLMPGSVALATMDRLFPLATVITPNIDEAQELSGIKISTREDAVVAGRELLKRGSQYVLIKGGHLQEAPGLDILVGPSQDSPVEFVNGHKFVENRDVRGTGCAYASAIACGLATGLDILESDRIVQRTTLVVQFSMLGVYPTDPGCSTIVGAIRFEAGTPRHNRRNHSIIVYTCHTCQTRLGKWSGLRSISRETPLRY